MGRKGIGGTHTVVRTQGAARPRPLESGPKGRLSLTPHQRQGEDCWGENGDERRGVILNGCKPRRRQAGAFRIRARRPLDTWPNPGHFVRQPSRLSSGTSGQARRLSYETTTSARLRAVVRAPAPARSRRLENPGRSRFRGNDVGEGALLYDSRLGCRAGRVDRRDAFPTNTVVRAPAPARSRRL